MSRSHLLALFVTLQCQQAYLTIRIIYALSHSAIDNAKERNYYFVD